MSAEGGLRRPGKPHHDIRTTENPMTKRKSIARAFIFLLGGLTAAAAWGHEHHDHSKVTGVVKQRMETMSEMAKRMKAIGRRLRAKEELASISKDAAAVRDLAAAMTPMFPPGSTQPPTEASAEIWKNFSDFENRAKTLTQEADKLAGISGASDQKLAAQVAAVTGTCSGCHEKYRVRQ